MAFCFYLFRISSMLEYTAVAFPLKEMWVKTDRYIVKNGMMLDHIFEACSHQHSPVTHIWLFFFFCNGKTITCHKRNKVHFVLPNVGRKIASFRELNIQGAEMRWSDQRHTHEVSVRIFSIYTFELPHILAVRSPILFLQTNCQGSY